MTYNNIFLYFLRWAREEGTFSYKSVVHTLADPRGGGGVRRILAEALTLLVWPIHWPPWLSHGKAVGFPPQAVIWGNVKCNLALTVIHWRFHAVSVSKSVLSLLQVQDSGDRRRSTESARDIFLKSVEWAILKSFPEDETQSSRPAACEGFSARFWPALRRRLTSVQLSAAFISQKPQAVLSEKGFVILEDGVAFTRQI